MRRAWMGWSCALLLGALVWLGWPGADEATAQAGGSASPTAAPSLRGTQADGRARVEANGALRVDAELRRLFDYQLAALGERDLPATRKAVEQALSAQLSGTALKQALDLFDRYVAYRRALSEGKAAGGVAERLQQMRALRLQFLSAGEVAGLFGDEDVYDDFTVKRLRIAAVVGLSAEQKAARLKALEAGLPAELRAARLEPVKHLSLAEAEEALRKKGGGEQELYALRAGMVGQAAADRLSQLDREQAQWQSRVEAYRLEARRLQTAAGLDAAQRRQALAGWRAQRFSAQEQLRLDALVPPQ
ncbi:hypothetical protein JW897_04420 [Chromobacterium alkanivorans]|uniref:lipase secretion chaperone n=1 Tax=Chromobacterium alkanivorans TaxID=1071719 RepID=UPI00196823B7|nr:lipase secretion chaperone [Chromobacterium alkanivorans]MBN3002975.1 hypothetical protein [Chromobacterium alkanivorans]